MGMLRFGLQNVLRSRVRLLLVTLLIAFPFFLLLVMQSIGTAIERQTEILKRSVDTSLQLRARGALGHINMEGSSDTLPDGVVDKLRHVAHVRSVEPYALAMMPTEGTNFAMNVGINPGDTERLESHGEAGRPRIVAGRDLTPRDQGKDVALIGQGFAKFAGISPARIGSDYVTIDPRRSRPGIFAIDQPRRRLRVIGIFSSGYVFGDMQLFIPMDTFRRIYGLKTGLSWVFTTADSVDHLPAMEEEIRQSVGDAADVITPKTAAAFESSATTSIRQLARAGSYLAGFLMVTVIFFVMLLVVRDRAREIGTLKAMGASNAGIVTAFLGEATAFTIAGGVVASLVFAAYGGPVQSQLFAVGMQPFLPPQYKESLGSSLPLSSDVGPATIALVVLVALVVAALGSAYSVGQITRLSPLEAMRHD